MNESGAFVKTENQTFLLYFRVESSLLDALSKNKSLSVDKCFFVMFRRYAKSVICNARITVKLVVYP